MITHDQLIYAIEQELGLTHGVDFLVAHPIDKKGKQTGEAFLARWENTEVPKPDIEAMKQLYRDCHCVGFEERAVRKLRDHWLTTTDWTQTANVPRSLADRYAAYRQALRDIPQQAGFPGQVSWPALPQ